MDAPSLVERARSLLAPSSVKEKPLLGGTGFYVGERMAVAVVNDRLWMPAHDNSGVVGASPLVFAGRAVPGWIALDAAALDDNTLATWLRLGLARLDSSME